MINFRYHLVSLVSVFVALAVGIVLGAGPLSGPIESTFEDQITQLRQDKDALRLELEQSTVLLGFAAQGFTEAWPALVEDTLAERRVVVLTVGPSPAERLENLRKGLSQAGATLVGVVHLEDRYFKLDDAGLSQAVDQLADLGLGTRVEAAEQVVGRALAYVLAGGQTEALVNDPLRSGLQTGGESPTPGDEDAAAVDQTPTEGAGELEPDGQGAADQLGEGTNGQAASPTPGANGQAADPDPEQVWLVLASSGLVSGDLPQGGAEGVAVLASHLEKADSPVDKQVTQDRAAAAGALWHALDKLALPTVVAGPSSQAEDLVTLIRADKDQAELTTTLDAPISAAEVVGILWAVANGLTGQVGSYGLGAQDGNAMPPIPVVEAPPETEPSDEPVQPTAGNGAEPDGEP